MRLQNGEGGKIMHKFKKLVSKKVDGKNYYSILYFDETDGEIHQGFSSGSLDVISDFLKEFFINNNTERHALETHPLILVKKRCNSASKRRICDFLRKP